MAMRRIDDDNVDAGLHQRRRPVLRVAADADCRAGAQASVRVLRGVGEGLRLEDVFYRDEPFKLIVLINYRELLHLRTHEDVFRVVERRSHRRRYQVFLRHNVGDWLV